MNGTIVLDVLLATGGGLTLVGLVTFGAYAIKQGKSDSVFITIERAGQKKHVLAFPPDSPQVRQLIDVTEDSRRQSVEPESARSIQLEALQQKSSGAARKISWLLAALRILAILAIMLAGVLTAAFVGEGIWAIVISIIAVIGVPLVSFFVILGSDRRTQRLVASIYSFRDHEKHILRTGRDHAVDHDAGHRLQARLRSYRSSQMTPTLPTRGSL